VYYYYERNHQGNVVLQCKHPTENIPFFGLKENYVSKLYYAKDKKMIP